MFGEDPKQLQSDEFFGLFSAFLVSFAVSHSLLTPSFNLCSGEHTKPCIFYGRPCGRVVRAPDLKSEGWVQVAL